MMEYLEKAKKDFLTGCFIKEEMRWIITGVRDECSTYKRPFSILVLDLDHFKSYNDKYGHLDGDEVLRYFSGMLHISFPDTDCIPVRFGGDEFIVIFPGKGGREANALVNNFARNLRKKPFLMRGRVFKLSFSGGLISYPSDGRDIEDLLGKADKAMYYSKTHGRGRSTNYHSMGFQALGSYFIIILIGLVIAGFIFYLVRSEKLKIGNTMNRFRRGIDATLAPSLNEEKSAEFDHIFMKSGRVFNGRIIRETQNSIEFRLYLTTGEGYVAINKSDIDRIEKATAKK